MSCVPPVSRLFRLISPEQLADRRNSLERDLWTQFLRAGGPSFPDLDLNDPTWGNLEDPDWSIEFNIGREDPVESIMLHVRGGGDVVEVIRRAARALGCRALDGSSGEFIEDGGADGWADFQAYRDSVLGQGGVS